MKNKEKGFTLIELMLVVSIMLVLMGFMIPKFSAYQNKVKETKAVNIAKQIQTAAMASYGYNDGKFIKEDITGNITTLTSLKGVGVNDVKVNRDGQSVNVNYVSDETKYTLTIDAAQNTCEVSCGTTTIFPKTTKTTTEKRD
ncbi:type II secretion system protein [Clostridium sp. A1-XYC3]|uniref:Type II secretion system protein n=1 Tax=Clostridium tanneri TaxID=3037988 RepID=A0ABU4JN72_9CLOT|nr:type II secretion system protein [Clostridium sp. A1-XYC3]MDW8799601.1 type II secretion system protein [Clostridium sp. A1-XYC3]